MKTPEPPRLPNGLSELPRDLRYADALLGDLEEGFARRARMRQPLRAGIGDAPFPSPLAFFHHDFGRGTHMPRPPETRA